MQDSATFVTVNRMRYATIFLDLADEAQSWCDVNAPRLVPGMCLAMTLEHWSVWVKVRACVCKALAHA